MADLERVMEVIRTCTTNGVRDLSARQNGSIVEIHGSADSLEAKKSFLHAIEHALGDSRGINDCIRVPYDPGREGAAEGTSSVRSVPSAEAPRRNR